MIHKHPPEARKLELTPVYISLADLIQFAPFRTDLACFCGLCQADPASPVICQASPHTWPLIQGASVLRPSVLRRQAVGLPGLFQICQSHTLQDIHTASAVKHNPVTAGPLYAFCSLPVSTCGFVWRDETSLSSETPLRHPWPGSDTTCTSRKTTVNTEL